MDEVNNTGYAGVAMILPHVWTEFDSRVTKEQVKHDGQTEYVAMSLVDLTEAIWGIGRLLGSDDTSVALKNRTKNNEMYDADLGTMIEFAKGKISALFNNVMIIGQTALLLLETMLCYINLIDFDGIDDWAWEIVQGVKQGIFRA